MLHPSKTLSAISLFSGAGGLDLGFENAGFDILFANELDPDAAATWEINRPDSKAMRQGDLNHYLDELGQYEGVDVVFGGPPCQGFSVAGKMDPNDPRSQLMWSYMKAVENVNPRVFIIENVRALGSLSKWQNVRQSIIDRADELGYDCDYSIFTASDFGVPQNRERVVFVGVKKSTLKLDGFLSRMQASRSKPKTLRAVLEDAGRYDSKENPQTCTSHVSLAKNPVLRRSPYAGMLVNGAGRPLNLDAAAHTLPASMGGNKTPIVDQSALEEGKENWFVSYHRNLMAGKTRPEKERVPQTVRRLTIKEAAAVQTFPNGYVFCGKKTQQYKQIGNAVAVDFASAIARSVKAAYF